MVDATQEGGTPPGIDYAALMRDALRGVVRQALALAAAEGLPGDHHFFLTFGTAEEGVLLPARLLRQFPAEITIVLQHQYWNLAVDDAGFAVTLRFGGAPERLVVPWPALRAFADPSVGFGLRLQPGGDVEQETAPAVVADAADSAPPPDAQAETAPPAEPVEPSNVVDFGAFRRRSPGGQD
jgi:hypothetical protein